MNIVLDLDETLVSVTTSRPTKYNFEFKLGNQLYYVKKRPYLTLFLRYLFKNFDSVSVWTAATRPYAIKILENIMSEHQRNQLAFFLTRENLRFKDGKNYTKPLEKIFKNSKHMTSQNTIMIDDRKSAMSDNCGNAFIIDAWKGQPNDRELAKLMLILDGVLKNANTFDFASYNNCFNINEITKN